MNSKTNFKFNLLLFKTYNEYPFVEQIANTLSFQLNQNIIFLNNLRYRSSFNPDKNKLFSRISSRWFRWLAFWELIANDSINTCGVLFILRYKIVCFDCTMHDESRTFINWFESNGRKKRKRYVRILRKSNCTSSHHNANNS